MMASWQMALKEFRAEVESITKPGAEARFVVAAANVLYLWRKIQRPAFSMGIISFLKLRIVAQSGSMKAVHMRRSLP
jgi:hypothetical protein